MFGRRRDRSPGRLVGGWIRGSEAPDIIFSMVQTCPRCEITKPRSDFYSDRHRACKQCRCAAARANPQKRSKSYKIRALERQHHKRFDPARRAYFIVRDTRASDHKTHRANDLTLAFVKASLIDGCSYCGATNLKMTLDRIDNAVGHIQTNVRAACVRCNYMRRDMPFIAWMSLVPAIRSAHEAGLFGTWTCDIKRKKAYSKRDLNGPSV